MNPKSNITLMADATGRISREWCCPKMMRGGMRAISSHFGPKVQYLLQNLESNFNIFEKKYLFATKMSTSMLLTKLC